MTHEDLVDRVARAIWEANGDERDVATAALAAVYEAIKEPTPEMVEAVKLWSARKYGHEYGLADQVASYTAQITASPLNPEVGE